MGKHKTFNLEGALLDAAVAIASGYEVLSTTGRPRAGLPIADSGCLMYPAVSQGAWSPSTMWKDGGPIIERWLIELVTWRVVGREASNDVDDPQWNWVAYLTQAAGDGCVEPDGHGPTPLIAAMRAYIASKLGEEVELP